MNYYVELKKENANMLDDLRDELNDYTVMLDDDCELETPFAYYYSADIYTDAFEEIRKKYPSIFISETTFNTLMAFKCEEPFMYLKVKKTSDFNFNAIYDLRDKGIIELQEKFKTRYYKYFTACRTGKEMTSDDYDALKVFCEIHEDCIIDEDVFESDQAALQKFVTARSEMSKSENGKVYRKDNFNISARVSETVNTAFEKLKEETGLNTKELLVKLILQAKTNIVITKTDVKQMHEFKNELIAQGNNLNQLAHRINSNQIVFRQDFEDLRNEYIRLLDEFETLRSDE